MNNATIPHFKILEQAINIAAMKWDEDRDGDDEAQLVCDGSNESTISMRSHVAQIGAKPRPGAPASFKAPAEVLRNHCNQ